MKHVQLIKSLLRLARDSAASPAEAAQALNRAMTLIEKHKIDVATLDLDEETENLVRENIPCGARVSLIRFLIGNILLNHFNVRIVHRKRYGGFNAKAWRHKFETDIVVLGLESDVQIARYVFDFLLGAHIRGKSTWAAGEKKARRKVNDLKKTSFTRGWIYGVASNLHKPIDRPELTDSKVALVLAAKDRQLDDFKNEQFPGAVEVNPPKKREIPNALTQGFIAGKATSIHQPLKGGEEQLTLC